MDIADFLDRKQAENGRKGMSRNEILEIESHAVGRTGSYASGHGSGMKENPKIRMEPWFVRNFAGRNQQSGNLTGGAA